MSPLATTTSAADRTPTGIISSTNDGKIELIVGPMFSGKSTELHRRIRRHKIAGRSILLVKYKDDVRYDDVAGPNASVTHDHQSLPAMATKDFDNVNNIAHNFDVIGIDEAQFFGDIVAFCERWANRGKVVIAAALDGRYQRVVFNEILELVPLAESVDKLSAVCAMCAKDASFTLRTSIVEGNSVELIGGVERYKAACRKCYLAAMEEQTKEATNVSARKEKVNGGSDGLSSLTNSVTAKLESLALEMPENKQQNKLNATPLTGHSVYADDSDDTTFTFLTPNSTNSVLLDKLGVATGKLGENLKKTKSTAKKSRGFGGPGRSPLTDFMNTSRSPITSLR